MDLQHVEEALLIHMIREHLYDGMGCHENYGPFVLRMADCNLLNVHMTPCSQEEKWRLVSAVGLLMGSLHLVLHPRLVGAHSCVIFVAAHKGLAGTVALNDRCMGCLGLGKDFVR